MNEINPIVENSLNFISGSLHKSFHPITSLPYEKSQIREAIKEHVKKCSNNEFEIIQTKYGLLSNFIDDEKAKFMIHLDSVLQSVDMDDTKACAEWTKDKKNDEDFKKFTLVLTEMNKERDELNSELNKAYETKS
jgi:hypothetical protein